LLTTVVGRPVSDHLSPVRREAPSHDRHRAGASGVAGRHVQPRPQGRPRRRDPGPLCSCLAPALPLPYPSPSPPILPCSRQYYATLQPIVMGDYLALLESSIASSNELLARTGLEAALRPPPSCAHCHVPHHPCSSFPIVSRLTPGTECLLSLAANNGLLFSDASWTLFIESVLRSFKKTTPQASFISSSPRLLLAITAINAHSYALLTVRISWTTTSGLQGTVLTTRARGARREQHSRTTTRPSSSNASSSSS
jgi:hypothetical protein